MQRYGSEGKLEFENIGREYKQYHKNGSLYEIGKFGPNGALEGTLKRFYDNGNIEEIQQLKNGKNVGVYRRYYKKGGLYQESKFKNGQLLESKQYCKNGNLMGEGSVKDHLGVSREYFPNGQLKSEKIYKDEHQLVAKKLYDMKGQCISNEPNTIVLKTGEVIKGEIIYKANKNTWLGIEIISGKILDFDLSKIQNIDGEIRYQYDEFP